MIFPWPWAPYIPILCIISGIAQYLARNNLSLLLDCQLLIFVMVLMGHAAAQGTFFSITQVTGGVLFWSPRQSVLKHFKKPKFESSSFLAFQISDAPCRSPRSALSGGNFFFFFRLTCFLFRKLIRLHYKDTCYSLDYSNKNG